MATTAKKSSAEKPVNRTMERVPVKLFKDGGKYSDDVTVLHNGKAYVIKRGITVMVPRAVALILERSGVQDTNTAQLIEKESAKFDTETKQRGL